MKKLISLLTTLFCTASFAASSPMIWGSPFPLILDGGLRFNESDTSTACSAATAGSIRYNAGTMEACNGTTWSAMSGGGGSSPLTTKGDIYVYSTLDTRLPVGTNTQVLSANSATATGLEWVAAGSGGANTTLSNLVSPTAINEDLIFDQTAPILQSKNQTVANSENLFIASGSTLSTFTSGAVDVRSGTTVTGASGGMAWGSGASTLGPTGEVNIFSGAAAAGNSGDLIARTGTATGTRGKIILRDGSEGTAGKCWVSSDTTGRGAWSSCGNAVISVRYSTGAGQSIPNGAGASTIVNYDTQEHNTNPGSVTTGAGWTFTAPRADKYHVSATIIYASGASWDAGDAIEFWIKYNGTDTQAVTAYQTSTHSTYVQISISSTIEMVASDTISIGTAQISGSAAPLLGATQLNWVNIDSVGGL